MASRRRRSIEADTPLIPAMIADDVVQEIALALHARRDELDAAAAGFLDDPASQRALSDALAARAEATYRTDARLARDVHREACRELLARWMRPWAAERVLADLGPAAHAALPEGFPEGDEPEFQAPAPRP